MSSFITYFFPNSLNLYNLQTNSPLVSRDHGSSTARVVPCNLTVLDAFAQVQEWLQRAENSCLDMGHQMDQFPTSGKLSASSASCVIQRLN